MEFAEAEGRRIAYWAEGAGTPVVLIHGSFSTSAAWKRVLKHLNQTLWKAIPLDLPGWGESAPLPDDVAPVDFEALAVESVVKQATSQAVHLVGHSSGGTVALAVALRHRVSVRSLTLFEPLPLSLLADTGDGIAFQRMSDFVSQYRTAFENGSKWAAAAVIDLWGGAGTFDAMPPTVREFVAGKTAQNLRTWDGCFMYRPALDELRALEIPTTLVQGALSPEIVKLVVTRLHETLPCNTVLEMKDANHFMIQTHPAESAQLIGKSSDA